MPKSVPHSVPQSATSSLPRVRLGRIAVLAAGATLMGAAASCNTAGKPNADAGSGEQTMTGSGGGGGNATGGGNGSPDAGTGGSSGSDAAQEAPIAIYAAAVALPRNQG